MNTFKQIKCNIKSKNFILLYKYSKYNIYHCSSYNIKFNKIKIITSKSNDINMNIAYENKMIDKDAVDCPILYLWRNDRNIVIGKYQNPWKECQINKLKADNVSLARRKSGGGAVYQDLGNVIYSFLLPNIKQIKDFRQINKEILLNTFEKLNINAEFSGRNDILIDNKKFSGNAFRIIPNLGDEDNSNNGKFKRGKNLHHGTMLYNCNLDMLSEYLNVNKLKLQSKGVDSVKSRVINIIDKYPNIDIQDIYNQLKKSFIEYYDCDNLDVEHIELPNKNFDVNNDYKQLTSWNWLYGSCPEFSNSIEYKFNWGLIDLSLDVIKGRIKKANVYSDTLIEGLIDHIRSVILDIDFDNDNNKYNYDENGIKELLQYVKLSYDKIDCSNVEFNNYFDDMIETLPKLV